MPRLLLRAPTHDRNFSLGWLATAWMEFFCLHGDGDVLGEPVIHGDEYTGLIVDAYALHPPKTVSALRVGRRLYDSVFFSRPKGADKSGLGARFAMFEALGPCRFAGIAQGGEVYRDPWGLGFKYVYTAGEPMGKPVRSPFIRCMATEETQPLALDTVVPTPDGWSTIGDLAPGDSVFGSDGVPVEVRRVTEVFDDLECYEVTFSDGDRITASGSHAWTLEKRDLKTGHWTSVTTSTAQMADDFFSSYRGNRYRQQIMPAFELPAADLSVDPWFLGLWLGDGKTADSGVAYDMQDHEFMVEQIASVMLPGETAVWGRVDNCGDVRIKKAHGRRNLDSLRNRLRAIGVLGDKHIPAEYLRASRQQRMALLQGLIDSDGTVNKAKGRAIFTNKNRRLIEQTGELLTSLGFKWDQHQTKTGAWRIAFQPHPENPVTRIPRKTAKHRVPSGITRAQRRHVINVERVETVPVKCIGIDTEDHLFAVGRRAVLTHNTGNVYDNIYYNLTEGPLAAAMNRRDDAGLTRVNLPNRGEITPSTASSSSKDGGKETFVDFDESHLYDNPELRRMYATVTRNLRKRKKIAETWFLETTTMFAEGDESIAEKTYTLAEQMMEGRTVRKDGLLLDHQWGECEDVNDIPKLRAAIREAYGDAMAWIDEDGIVDEFFDPRADEEDSRRYFLNAKTSHTHAYVRNEAWDAVRLPADSPDRVVEPGEVITLGFDGSRKRSRGVTDATALIGCRVRDGYLFTIQVWEQPPNLGNNKDGTPKTWGVPHAAVDRKVHETFEKYRVVGFYADPAKWETYVAEWEAKYRSRLKVKSSVKNPIEWWMVGGEARKVYNALESFYDGIVEKQLCHGSAPTQALTRHMLNARRRYSKSGYGIHKEHPSSPKKIDAAIAAVLAYQARLDALAKGVTAPKRKQQIPVRIR